MTKTALLVIDVQDSFLASRESVWQLRSNVKFEKNVSRLLDGFRQLNQPVFFVLHSDPDEHFRVTSPHYKCMDFLNVCDDDVVLHKTTKSSFASTDLHTKLVKLGVSRLVISGIQTEQCCETTARAASDLGYEVDFVTEATLTFPIEHWSQDRLLSANDIVERTEFVLANRFARIATVDLALQSLA